MAQHYYSSKSVATTLSASINNSQTTFTCPDVAGDNGWPTSFPFTLAIDYGSVGVELVDVTSKGAVTTGVRTWNCTRAIDFTTASAHSSGATVQHVIAARDFTEARQARTLQPLDSENTYVIREGTAGSEFTDSTVGDLVVKVKSGKTVLIGADGSGFSNLYVNAASAGTSVPFLTSAGFRRGSGTTFGTNYVVAARTSVQAITANTWTDVVWSAISAQVNDDGSGNMAIGAHLVSYVSGLYMGVASLSYSLLTGTHYMRWMTQGGTVYGQTDTGVAIQTLPMIATLPGGGYYVTVQCNLTNGQNVVATASGTPTTAWFCQVL